MAIIGVQSVVSCRFNWNEFSGVLCNLACKGSFKSSCMFIFIEVNLNLVLGTVELKQNVIDRFQHPF